MKASSTHQAILEKRRTEGIAEGIAQGKSDGAAAKAKRAVCLLGEQPFGPPDAAASAAMEQLEDLVWLEDGLRRVSIAANWLGLFGQPMSGHRRRGRRPLP